MLKLLVALFLSTLAVGTARAQPVEFTGTLMPGGPTMPVVFISTPNCTGQGMTPVLYEAHPLNVTTGGVYTFTLTSPADFASFYLYINTFNSMNGLVNCIAAANNGMPKTFTYGLDQFNTYHVVVFDDQFAQTGGDYRVTVDPPSTTTTTSSSTTSTTLPGCGTTATFDSVTCRLAALREQVEADVPDARLAGKLSGALTKARALVRLAEGLGGDAKGRRALAKALRSVKRFGKLLGSRAGRQVPSPVREELVALGSALEADIPNLPGA